MEVLNALEKKIELLVGVMKKLKEDNDLLYRERAHYQSQIETLERALLAAEEKSKEIGLTTVAVDELIKHIDMLVEHEIVRTHEPIVENQS